MLEEALPLVVGVAVALLPCLAFGSLAATRSFVFLGAEEAGVLKALEAGKSEEEALAGATIASPYEPYASPMCGLLSSYPSVTVPAPRLTGGASYGFAARGAQ